MEEYIFSRIIKNKKIFNIDEIEKIYQNKELVSLIYLLGIIDTIMILKDT